MVRRIKLQRWHGFVAGQQVRMLVETRGATAADEEITHPPGTLARVGTIADFGEFQGLGVDVVIGERDRAICNSFDDRDVEASGGVPFACI